VLEIYSKLHVVLINLNMELNKEYIRSLSNEDLFQILKSYDNSIGPVIPSTRSVYENKLIKMFENKVLLKIKQQSSAQSTNNLEASNKKIQIKSNLKLLKNSPNNNSNSENQINKLKKLEQELKNIKIKVIQFLEH